jgi:hypothetical protein
MTDSMFNQYSSELTKNIEAKTILLEILKMDFDKDQIIVFIKARVDARDEFIKTLKSND